MTEHTQANGGGAGEPAVKPDGAGDDVMSEAKGTEDAWRGGDPRIEVLARVEYEHHLGACELVASVNREAGVFGVSCSTYDKYCPYPHERVTIVVTGGTLFEACLEIYYYRRLDDWKLELSPERIETNPQRFEGELLPASKHVRVRQLWIPPDHVERLHSAAAAKLSVAE